MAKSGGGKIVGKLCRPEFLTFKKNDMRFFFKPGSKNLKLFSTPVRYLLWTEGLKHLMSLRVIMCPYMIFFSIDPFFHPVKFSLVCQGNSTYSHSLTHIV